MVVLTLSSFYVHVTDASNTEHSFKGDSTGHIVYLPLGSYKTSVSGPKGYTASILGVCSGNAAMGNDFQCTVKMTNNPTGQESSSNYGQTATSQQMSPPIVIK